MVLPFLPIIEHLNLCSQNLPLKTFHIIGQVLIQCTSSNNKDEIVRQLSALSPNGLVNVIVDVTGQNLSLNEIIDIFDAGASKIVVSKSELQELKDIPVDRILVRVSEDEAKSRAELDNVTALSSGIILDSTFKISNDPEILQSIVSTTQKHLLPAGGQRTLSMKYTEQPTIPELKSLALLSIQPIFAAKYLTSSPKDHRSLLSIAQIALLGAKTDRPDGLFTTLVVDEQNHALGLVYSSPESIAESINTGTGVYQSRQRGLWYKGATSGATQELLGMSWDCDADCLRYTVRQAGKGTHCEIIANEDSVIWSRRVVLVL